MIERFKMEARAVLKELDLGFRERSIIHQMPMNIKRVEEGKMYEYNMIGEDPYRRLGYEP